jgi:hypothetical protein
MVVRLLRVISEVWHGRKRFVACGAAAGRKAEPKGHQRRRILASHP